MIKYGLISETDGKVLEKTIDFIVKKTPKDDNICITEIGLFNCDTAKGIREYLSTCVQWIEYTGIDNFKDKYIEVPEWMTFIYGNSNEVYNQLKDESQHLIFVDGCHTYSSVVSDFMCYKNKVIKGAYIAFHDVGAHLKKTDGWQGVGDKNDSDFCLGGVRKALKELGLFDNKFEGWEFVMEDADINDEGGGIAIFRRK